MRKAALVKAERCFRRAVSAAHRFRHASFVTESEDAWEDFLDQVGKVYDRVENGAKGFGKSEAWYGRIRYDRKKDPLLLYIHLARNIEEHGLVRSSQYAIAIHAPEGVHVEHFEIKDGKSSLLYTTLSKDLHPEMIFRLRLRRVVDTRFGNSAEPATSHLGRPVNGHMPGDVIAHMLVYLRAMLDEAKNLQIVSK